MKTNKIIITVTVIVVLALLGAGAYILLKDSIKSTAQTTSQQSDEVELGRVTTGDIKKNRCQRRRCKAE